MKIFSPSRDEGKGDFRALLFGAWWLSAIMLLAGCAVGPNYHRPPVNSPPDFRSQNQNQAGTNSFADMPWWEVFHDETLQGLLRVALTNNYDLRIALTRVEQSREQVIEARSGLFPQLNYGAFAGRGKNVGANGTPSPTGITAGAVGADVGASWDIDLWGRTRRMTEAARAQYFASEQARRDVMTLVISEVAQDYFQLLELDRQLEIAENTTNLYGESLRIFNERLHGGVASKLETSSAEALLASTAAAIPNLEEQIALQENQLSVLLGQNPGAIPRASSLLTEQMPPEVPAGLPSALLERRPDVREAEEQLRSANAQVGVTVADFFPDISLTAFLGRVSPGLSAITGGAANAWGVAANLAGPIFHGGQLRAQYRGALAARNQFALQYQAAILNAFQEVSNALISREKSAEVRVQDARAVDAYREAVQISQERYRLGQASYYEVLQEQQLLFPAENSLAQTELNQLVAVVQLYRALGGGWEANSLAH